TQTTEDEVNGKVSVPNFPKDGVQPVISVATTQVPNGKTSGEFEVQVTVTYTNKTTNQVNGKVHMVQKHQDTSEPKMENITKKFKKKTTKQKKKKKKKNPKHAC
ncbi:hypothetical protein, partial [Staphylococcus simulans]